MALAQKAALLAASGLATLIAAAPASAQYFERDRNQSVRERPQPEYDPIGIAVGAFRAYATLPVGVTYNDNVFATENNEQDDTVFVVSPSAELRSQWSRHFLGIYANLDSETYDELDDENRTNFSVSSSGRLDVQRGFTVDGQVAHRWFQEARTEASSPANTLEPIDYTDVLVGLGASKEFNRLRFSGRVDHEEFDFDNAILADGMGTVVLQDNRDHESLSYTGRADYAVTDATAVFGAISSRQRDYALQPNDDPRVGFSRDSKGMTYSVGANFDLTRLVRGEIAVGYLTEDFIDPMFGDVDGLSTSASVEWFATPVATVELTAERSVTDTGIAGAAASLTTVLGARVDYELRRNVIVTGQLSHRDDEYEGIARDDAALAAAVDVVYLFNRHVGASVSYGVAQRESSGAARGPEFDQQRFGLNLVLRY